MKYEIYHLYHFLILIFIILFIYFWLLWVFVGLLGLSLVVATRGYALVAMRLLLLGVASLIAEPWVQGMRATVVAARRLGSWGSRAKLLQGMWHLPGPGIKPVSPALTGGFFTTEPPGKPFIYLFLKILLEYR